MLNPTDDENRINKHNFRISSVCVAVKNMGEHHVKLVMADFLFFCNMDDDDLFICPCATTKLKVRDYSQHK